MLTCFGAPFLTRKPEVYADMFASRLKKSGARAWLINTGWTGGGADTGHWMPIAATRALLQAAMDGTLSDGPFVNGSVWTTRIPSNGPDEAARFLHPENTWADKQAFEIAAKSLRGKITDQLDKLGLENTLIRETCSV
ncbi:phosphoenolpyruvate carboxykinase (ATP) [Ruegeria arenilitoris]|uniref:phosphoenolpyruvate carboxykinase (ATP) n=1 Tax=Ruegeria arenilitoris TaxID=1173585 RepID=UPI00147F1474